MPYITVVAGQVITAAWSNANVRDQVITPFVSAATRAAAITAPVTGMYSDVGGLDRYDGTKWVPAIPKVVGTKFHTNTFTWVTAETAMAAWHASSDANVTFGDGKLYEVKYSAGYSYSAGFASNTTIRLRKAVNSVAGTPYWTWQLSLANTTRHDIVLRGILKNASGADISTSLGLTGQSIDGGNHILIGDATTPAILTVSYIGMSADYPALAAAATSIT